MCHIAKTPSMPTGSQGGHRGRAVEAVKGSGAKREFLTCCPTVGSLQFRARATLNVSKWAPYFYTVPYTTQ